MNTNRTLLINLMIAIATSLCATMIMMFFTGESGVLKFVGWLIFFAGLQVSTMMALRNSPLPCSAWLHRILKRN